METDIAVIGAGALGLSTALHCALTRPPVVVVWTGTRPGRRPPAARPGCSSRCRPTGCARCIARRSIDRAAQLRGLGGRAADVARSGSFLVARTDKHQAFLPPRNRPVRQLGVDVTRGRPAANWPSAAVLLPAATAASSPCWCPEDCYIEEPTAWSRPTLAACRLHGVQLAGGRARDGVGPDVGGRVTGARDRQPPPVDHRPPPWWTRPGRGPGRSRELARRPGGRSRRSGTSC